MVVCQKKQKHCGAEERQAGDCWIGGSIAKESGLILSVRVGKHTDQLIAELIASSEGKTDAKVWYTDGWAGYERILTSEVTHIIGTDKTQRIERTNGIIRQQTGRWHRRQNKFGKVWEQTKITARLVVSHFNWIWKHSRTKNTAAQRAGLASRPWSWHDIATYPTLY